MAFQFLCPQGHLLQAEPWQAGQQSMCPYCGSLFVVPMLPGGSGGGVASSGGTLPGKGTWAGGELGMPPTIGPETTAPAEAIPSVGGMAPSVAGTSPSVAGMGPSVAGMAPSVGGTGPSEASMGPFVPGIGGGVAWPGMAETEGTATTSVPPQEGFFGGSPFASASQQTPWAPESQAPAESESPILFTGPAGISPTEPAMLHILCPSGHPLQTPRQMLGQEAICPFCQVQFRLRWEDSLEYCREKELERERRMARQSKLWMQWSIAAAVAVVIAVIVMIVIAASH